MSSNIPRVLVLDGMWNKTLAAVRSFGEKGFFVAAGETTRLSTSLFSKYVNRKLVYPSPITRSDDFMGWLIKELKEGAYDMLLPTELSTQLLIAKHRNDVCQYTRFPFPEAALAEKVHDKAWLMKFAEKKGYLVPKTYFVDGGKIDSVEKLAKKIKCPVVIKPRNSSGSRGLVYVFDKREFFGAYMKVHGKYPFPIVQEYIPPGGGGYGVGALFNFNHEPRAAFVYKRLREYPVTGGPSTLRESVKWDELKNAALSILKELKWVGPAMVEFKVDPADGKPRLLEINPRIWGSLQLAIISGVDFPYLLYKLCMDGDVEPVMTYKAGVKCRWLLPGDMMHLLKNPERLKTIRSFFTRSDGYDILSLKDPAPAVGRFFSILPFLYMKDMRRLLAR